MKKAMLTGSFILYKNNKGSFFAPSIYDNGFFERYTQVFSEVVILAKIILDENVQNFLEIKNNRLIIIEMKYFHGLSGLIFKGLFESKKIINAINEVDIMIYRIAQIESFLTYMLTPKKKYKVIEVVNDPSQFKNINFLFRFLLLIIFKSMLKKSKGRSFVTRNYLQNKYLNTKNNVDYIDTHYSSVDIDVKYLKRYVDLEIKNINILKIVHVNNNIIDNSKGSLTMIYILEKLTKSNINVNLSYIGEGKYINKIKKLIKEKNLDLCVNFIGKIANREKYYTSLSNHDLLVLPSKFEGLPRTIIESMAIGLPVLSSNISGIPELISNDFLCSPDDIECFADKIIKLYNQPTKLLEMANSNIINSRDYDKNILSSRRRKFFEKIIIDFEEINK